MAQLIFPQLEKQKPDLKKKIQRNWNLFKTFFLKYQTKFKPELLQEEDQRKRVYQINCVTSRTYSKINVNNIADYVQISTCKYECLCFQNAVLQNKGNSVPTLSQSPTELPEQPSLCMKSKLTATLILSSYTEQHWHPVSGTPASHLICFKLHKWDQQVLFCPFITTSTEKN